MKKLLIIIFVPILLTFVMLMTNKSFQNICYLIAWNLNIVKINNVQEAISKNPNTLLTVKMKSPPTEHVQSILKWIQYFQAYYKSISKLDSEIEMDLKKIGIQRPLRHIASSNNIITNEYIEKLNKLSGKNNIESIFSLGLNKDNTIPIDFTTKDYNKYLDPNFAYIDISIKIPRQKNSSNLSLVSFMPIDPLHLIESYLKNVDLDSKSQRLVSNFLAEINFSKDMISGIPVFIAKHNKLATFLIYMTALNKENYYLTSNKESLIQFIDNLKSKSMGPSISSSDFLWAQLNLEMLISKIPDKFKFFLPASARNLKNLTVASNLTDSFSLEGKIEFSDKNSPLETLTQIEALSKLSKKPRNKIKGLDINTDDWLKKFFSYSVKENFIISKLEIPLSEPRSKIESYFKQEFKNLSQDKTLIHSVIKYMKSNNLVQIQLKDLENTLSFSSQNGNSKIPFIVRKGNSLSTKDENSNFKPFMFITQAQCNENAKFTFQIIDKAKTKPASMYKIFQDPNSINNNFEIDKNIQGLQVFIIKNSEYSKEWSMEFNTENNVQLITEDAPLTKSPYYLPNESKKIIKLTSESPCQIQFEPILIGQINPI